jgi:hypothetical protein
VAKALRCLSAGQCNYSETERLSKPQTRPGNSRKTV